MKLTKRIIDRTTYESWQDEQVTLLESRWRAGDIDEAELKSKVDVVRNGYAGKDGSRQFKSCILWDDQLKGFGLRVTPANVKTFIFKYRTEDRRTRVMTVCRYGDKTVDQARGMASKLRGKVDDDKDPLQEKRERRRKAKRSRKQTVRHLADDYVERQKKAGRKSWFQEKQRLEKDVIPVIGDKPASAVTQTDVERILNRIQRRAMKSNQKRGGKVQANRTRTLLVSLFNYALTDTEWREFVVANPAALIARPLDEKDTRRERVLEDHEIKSLWLALDELKEDGSRMFHPVVAAGFWFRMLTGQRWSEVRSMKWSDVTTETSDIHGELVDVARWLIPKEQTKTRKREHLVPLSPQAEAVIEEMRGFQGENGGLESYVFPSPRKPDAPLAHSCKAFARWREQAKIEVTDEGPLRQTDIRRTVVTGMSRLGIPLEIRQAVVNHSPQDVTRQHYDRYDYLAEKRAALLRWADHVDRSISDEKPQAKVVRMPQR